MSYQKTNWVNGETALNATNMNKIENELEILDNAKVPIGIGFDYYGTTAPENYMFADGSAISRTIYAELFAIIGTTYGAGDGSATFNLPDKRERVSVMYKENSTQGTSGATLGILGAKGGEFKHTQTEAELAAHNHDNILVTGQNISLNSDGSNAIKIQSASGVADASSNNLYTSAKGGSSPMNIMQPYLVCNYIIKVK